MVETVLELPDAGFRWLDVVAPTHRELADLAEQYGLHSTSVQDCLEPEHQPKHERIAEVSFVILRVFDAQAPRGAATVRSLTRKLAVFLDRNFLLSIHRTDLPFVAELRQRWRAPECHFGSPTFEIGNELLKRSLLSFETPLEEVFEGLSACEERVFRGVETTTAMQEIYLLKRRAAIFQRVLHLERGVVSELTVRSDEHAPYLQDLREAADRLASTAGHLLENANTLMNLHISLASHRTNEVMRILTLFSVFFMPLTFIVGVYGMNFHRMPELEMAYGYPLVLLAMVAVSGGIFAWFRRKGWLR